MPKPRPIPSKYKKLGEHIVVESGYSMKNGKKVPQYRIIGKIWGKAS